MDHQDPGFRARVSAMTDQQSAAMLDSVEEVQAALDAVEALRQSLIERGVDPLSATGSITGMVAAGLASKLNEDGKRK